MNSTRCLSILLLVVVIGTVASLARDPKEKSGNGVVESGKGVNASSVVGNVSHARVKRKGGGGKAQGGNNKQGGGGGKSVDDHVNSLADGITKLAGAAEHAGDAAHHLNG